MDETYDELRELMEEVQGGPNHGHALRRTGDDGRWREREDLSHAGAVLRDFLKDGGWTVVDGTTDREPGRPRAVDAVIAQAETLARVRAEVGYGLEDFRRLAGASRVRRDGHERAALAVAVAHVVGRGHGRGALKTVALAYDTTPKTIQRLCREARGEGRST